MGGGVHRIEPRRAEAAETLALERQPPNCRCRRQSAAAAAATAPPPPPNRRRRSAASRRRVHVRARVDVLRERLDVDVEALLDLVEDLRVGGAGDKGDREALLLVVGGWGG